MRRALRRARTRAPLALGGLLLAVVMTACGGRRDAAGSPGDSSGASRPHVRVAFSPHLSWGPIMLAHEAGFFADEGIDVELVSALRSEEGLVALVTGDIDVLPGPLHAGFLSAIARGAQIRITAGMAELAPRECSYFAIVARKGLDTTGTPVLARMRAGQDGASRYVVSRMLAKRGIAITDVETVRLPEAVMAMSLDNGSIDAAAVTEPALSRVARSGTLWLRAEDAVPGFQWAVLSFGDRLLSRERDTGMRFIRAYQRGVARFAEGKTDRNVTMLAKLTGSTDDDIRAACWPVFRPDSRINWASIEEFQGWARRERLMETFIPIERAWDSTFVAAASTAAAAPSAR